MDSQVQEVKLVLMGNGKSSASSAWANENLTTSSTVWEPEALASPGNLTEMQNLSPTANLLNNNLHISKSPG